MTKKDKPSTLIDQVYMATYKKVFNNSSELRSLLKLARRYVLDDDMSTFLADLSLTVFFDKRGQIIPHTHFDSVASFEPKGRTSMLIEQIRIAARAPFPITWVEYNFINYRKRADILMGRQPQKTYDFTRMGWLIEQHPQNNQSHKLNIVLETNHYLIPLVWYPVSLIWTVDQLSQEGTTAVAWCIKDKYSKMPSPPDSNTGMEEETRTVWALLASLDECPINIKEVRVSRGFVASHGGGYQKFLDHKTITLHVPKTEDLRVLARRVIAHTRRREHDVSGHWRRDWHFWPLDRCEHEWHETQLDTHECRHCRGKRYWIKAHKRGDRTIGIVVHDYEVVHP
jgi:hypothetical protein